LPDGGQAPSAPVALVVEVDRGFLVVVVRLRIVVVVVVDGVGGGIVTVV
jgi:hypothetical protein